MYKRQPLNPKVDKGVLTRVPNIVVYTLGAKAMGYRPITIPYPDVYQSMQTGVCDAVDGYPTAAAYTILGDVLKHWYCLLYTSGNVEKYVMPRRDAIFQCAKAFC